MGTVLPDPSNCRKSMTSCKLLHVKMRGLFQERRVNMRLLGSLAIYHRALRVHWEAKSAGMHPASVRTGPQGHAHNSLSWQFTLSGCLDLFFTLVTSFTDSSTHTSKLKLSPRAMTSGDEAQMLVWHRELLSVLLQEGVS